MFRHGGIVVGWMLGQNSVAGKTPESQTAHLARLCPTSQRAPLRDRTRRPLYVTNTPSEITLGLKPQGCARTNVAPSSLTVATLGADVSPQGTHEAPSVERGSWLCLHLPLGFPHVFCGRPPNPKRNPRSAGCWRMGFPAKQGSRLDPGSLRIGLGQQADPRWFLLGGDGASEEARASSRLHSGSPSVCFRLRWQGVDGTAVLPKNPGHEV